MVAQRLCTVGTHEAVPSTATSYEQELGNSPPAVSLSVVELFCQLALPKPPEESWTSHDMSLAEGATEDPSLQCDTMAKDQATVMLPVDNLISTKPANKGCQKAPPGAFCSDLRWRNRSGAGGKGK